MSSLSHSLAEGFRSPTTGAYGLGATGGRVAFVDDASAVFHNPANLLDLPRWEASAEPTLVHHSVSYESPTGARAATEDPWKLLPHFFTGGPLADDRIALGLGVSVPFGLSVDWGDGGAFHYTAPRYVQLKTMNFNPSAAFRLAEGLHLGVGLDAMYSELTLSQYFPWSLVAGVPGLPDGDMRGQGTGVGIGGNAGVTWQFAEHHRLAATVRTPMDVDYDGDFRSTNVPAALGGDNTRPFRSEIRFPTIVALGYGYEIAPGIKLEANAEWLEFSRFQTLPIELSPPHLLLPSEVRQEWRDTFTFGLGATWQINDTWRLLASYQHFQTPVPDQTLSPSIPDADQNAVSVGVGFRQGRHRLNLSYSRVFYDDRTITENQNPAYLGRFEMEVHLISAAYGFGF